MTLKYLLEKEFKMIRRNSFLPRMIIMMPLMMMLVFPHVGTMEVKDIRICIVDYDRSETSRRITERIVSSPYFILVGVTVSHSDAIRKIEKGSADTYLEIPRGYEALLVRNDSPQLFISSNSVNGIKGGLSNQYLISILNNVIAESRQSINPSVKLSGTIPVLYQFNPHLDYKHYMVPALMVMLLTIITGFLPALNIVSEKEKGTIEQINVSPVSKLVFVLSKLIPYWIIGFVVLSICLLIASIAYGIYPEGGLIPIYVSSALFVLIISGLGLVVSNHSETMQQAMFVMFFFMIVFFLMSGLFTPISSMPLWAQELTLLNPLRYFMQVIRGIFLKGSSLYDISTQLMILGLFAIVVNLWAIISYRKKN